MRRFLALSLALALLCTACTARSGGKEPPTKGKYELYFVGAGEKNGAALGGERRTFPQELETVGGLMQALLAGPADDGHTSPFPQGTTLRGWKVEEGVAAVDLSEAYGGLSGGDLSLADGCIVLTLCQLAEVESVYLTVEGHARPFRDQLLTPGDFLVENGFGGEEEVQVQLWFLQGEGLAPEERTLSLKMGDQPEIAALQALLAGPEERGLEPICPEGTQLLSLSEAGSCFTVNLSSAWQEGENDPRRLYGVVRTLAGLRPGAQVIFQVEGQRLERFSGVDLRQSLGDEPTGEPEASAG